MITPRTRRSTRPKGSPRHLLSSFLHRLHHNDHGAIAVLVLLTIWCLVALVGLLWNTAEYAARRQQVQNAADSAAHATATWVSRCINITAANNMLIAQDGSAEVISRAVLPTYNSLQKEIDREYVLINNPNLKTLRSRLPALLANIEKNYAILSSAYQTVVSDAGSVKFPDKKTAADYQTQLRQAGFAINWVEGVYVQGGNPAGPNPGPPGGPGEGLEQLVDKWTSETLTDQMRAAIIASLIAQGPPTGVQPSAGDQPVLSAFYSWTSNGTGQAVWDRLQGADPGGEQYFFKAEKNFADQLASTTIPQQLASLADYYHVTFQLTNHVKPSPDVDPQNPDVPVVQSQVQAPVMDQADIDPSAGLNHSDLIRERYGPDLESQFGISMPVTVTIDPVNPNTGFYESDGDDTLNLKFVASGSEILFPRQSIDTGIARVPTVTINCNPRFGGWGHSWIFPIERYFGNRIGKDKQGLQTQFFRNGLQPPNAGIDDLRLQLAQLLDKLAGINGFNIPDPAGTLTDTQIDPTTKAFDMITVLPPLTLPAGATASSTIRTDIDFTYRNAANGYMGAVRRLAAVIRQFGAFYNQFTVPIAVPTWSAKIDNATIIVAQALGQAETEGQEKSPDKGFMVLRSYQLWNKQNQKLPPTWWATANLQESLRTAILAEIVNYNVGPIGWRFFSAGVPDPFGAARAVIVGSPEINNAADVIALEMVLRPWPYEKTPPMVTVPPTPGIGRADRQEFFSYLLSAHNTDANAAKPLLTSIFGSPPNLVAYAQAETFNWMEYNDSYGGYATEKFDEVSGNESSGWTPVVTGLLACPRAWRTASIGGWNWRPRLATADMLRAACEQDPAFADSLRDSGMTAPTDNSISAANLH